MILDGQNLHNMAGEGGGSTLHNVSAPWILLGFSSCGNAFLGSAGSFFGASVSTTWHKVFECLPWPTCFG